MGTKHHTTKMTPQVRTILNACANLVNPKDMDQYLSDQIDNGSADNNYGIDAPSPDDFQSATDWLAAQKQFATAQGQGQ
jgi:hypothetical protein